ncbi:MAG: nucleotide exchange factor GrpE [Bacteroidota bacterium]|nr:nucleotide exchange factor GrpE [Bacteroidota bacterium]
MSKKKTEGNTKKKEAKKVELQEEKQLTIEELLALEKDQHLRLIAEFDNFRRRTAKERISLFSTAGQDIMTSLLPILDDLERAIEANNYDKAHGVVLIYNKLKSTLETKGLKEIENPIGKVLNTEMHEAISMVPAEKKKQKNKIIDTVEKGYLLGEKVIRHAKVVVAN